MTSHLPPSLEAVPRAPAASQALRPTQDYLVFRLGLEHYAVSAAQVQEVRSYEVPTRLPHRPAAVLGVLELRGSVVPVVDLRLQLGCEEATYDACTVVIVLQLQGRCVGVVVDAVADVVALHPQGLRPAPPLCDGPGGSYLCGIAQVDTRLLFVVEMQRLLGAQALGVLPQAEAVEA